MLKPEISLPVALATGAVVAALYQTHMPNLADVKASPSGNPYVNGSRKTTTLTAIGIVGAISLLSHDPTVFTVGGLMVIALDFAYRHADAQDHHTGKVLPQPTASATASSE